MPLLYFIDSHPIRDLNTYILNFCIQNEMTFVTLFSLEEKDPTVNKFTKDLQDSALLCHIHNLNNLLHISKKLV